MWENHCRQILIEKHLDLYVQFGDTVHNFWFRRFFPRGQSFNQNLVVPFQELFIRLRLPHKIIIIELFPLQLVFLSLNPLLVLFEFFDRFLDPLIFFIFKHVSGAQPLILTLPGGIIGILHGLSIAILVDPLHLNLLTLASGLLFGLTLSFPLLHDLQFLHLLLVLSDHRFILIYMLLAVFVKLCVEQLHDGLQLVVVSCFSLRLQLDLAKRAFLFEAQYVLVDTLFAEEVETVLDDHRLLASILTN